MKLSILKFSSALLQNDVHAGIHEIHFNIKFTVLLFRCQNLKCIGSIIQKNTPTQALLNIFNLTAKSFRFQKLFDISKCCSQITHSCFLISNRHEHQLVNLSIKKYNVAFPFGFHVFIPLSCSSTFTLYYSSHFKRGLI